jgi:hypothetical protein
MLQENQYANYWNENSVELEKVDKKLGEELVTITAALKQKFCVAADAAELEPDKENYEALLGIARTVCLDFKKEKWLLYSEHAYVVIFSTLILNIKNYLFEKDFSKDDSTIKTLAAQAIGWLRQN